MRTATSLFIFLAACTSDNISSDEFLSKLVAVECEQAFACKSNYPTSSDISFDELFGADVSACKSTLPQYYGDAEVLAGIRAGRIAYDGKAAAVCVDGISAPACQTYWDEGLLYPDECFEVLAGLVEAGGACSIDQECAGEMYCEGTCVP